MLLHILGYLIGLSWFLCFREVRGNYLDKYKGVSMAKDITDKELRERGYLTIEEFTVKLLPGLQSYMESNLSPENKDSVFHPEDLFSNALTYLEVGLFIVGSFGVNFSKDK